MHRFMIGQYGGFDYTKFDRDFLDGFFGMEACLFEGEEDIENLIKEAQRKSFRVGIHFPLRAGRSKWRDALFLSADNETRNQAYALIENELMEYAERVKPVYILFHYPKPVILDERVDWSFWRFCDTREFVYENKYSIAEFAERSESFFQWISVQAQRYNFTPILEFDALNRYVYDSDLLERLLQKYPRIKLCLDIGRLYVQEKIDAHFDSRSILRTYLKYAALIHLSTLRFDGGVEHYKHVVLPEQDPEDGWAPIEEYLQIVRSENADVNILFEHRSELVSDDDLRRCYAWVDQLLRGSNEAVLR